MLCYSSTIVTANLVDLGTHAQRGLRGRVSMSVCLTSGASVRPENTVTYSAVNGGQNICGVFSETASFKSYGVISIPTLFYSDIAAVFCAT